MGRKNSVVSFLCGLLLRKRPPPVDDADEFEDAVESPTSTSGAATKPCSPNHRQQQSLPTPPGTDKRHVRTASWSWSQRRSNSGVSKLVSSMSLRVMGGDRMFKREDSVWKKTIILGERCRVPDDDNLDLFDEKGNKIITYHPKSHSGFFRKL